MWVMKLHPSLTFSSLHLLPTTLTLPLKTKATKASCIIKIFSASKFAVLCLF